MMTLADVMKNDTQTENGMTAYKSSLSACVDFFYKSGGSRGKDLYKEWKLAAQENLPVALRLLFWVRDVRGGAGEREIFRKILLGLETDAAIGNVLMARDILTAIIPLIPEYGRVDDLFVFNTSTYKHLAAGEWWAGINSDNPSLFGKWSPRRGPVAEFLRKYVGLTPKQYRQKIVAATKVVETQMCAKKWNEIEFSKVPSLAHTRYTKAFWRNAPEVYKSYSESLKKGETKINTGAVYPYDIIKSLRSMYGEDTSVQDAQWKSLPDFVGDNKILPVVDVSGSMSFNVSGSTTALDVALSLGLYLSERNKSVFKDTFITFSGKPQIQHLQGSLSERLSQMDDSAWEMNTNLEAVFTKILDLAVNNNIPADGMPDSIVILSDMQTDMCLRGEDHMGMIRRNYTNAGYKTPIVVFWNLKGDTNIPVKFNEYGTICVSGFSPALMKSLLLDPNITPEKAMLSVIMDKRYDGPVLRVGEQYAV